MGAQTETGKPAPAIATDSTRAAPPDLLRLAECLERNTRLLLALHWYADIQHWYAPQLDGREVAAREGRIPVTGARPGHIGEADGIFQADGGRRAAMALSSDEADRLTVDLLLSPLAARQAAAGLQRYAQRFLPGNTHPARAVAKGLRGLAAEEAALCARQCHDRQSAGNPARAGRGGG